MEKIQELRLILKEKISSKAITQISLAKATGVDQATISRFYKHGEGLSAENFIRLTEGIGGKIIWPGENSQPCPDRDCEIDRLTEKCRNLEETNAALKENISLLKQLRELEHPLEKNDGQQNERCEERPASASVAVTEGQSRTGV